MPNIMGEPSFQTNRPRAHLAKTATRKPQRVWEPEGVERIIMIGLMLSARACLVPASLRRANYNKLQPDDKWGHPNMVEPVFAGRPDAGVFPPPRGASEFPPVPTPQTTPCDSPQGLDVGRQAQRNGLPTTEQTQRATSSPRHKPRTPPFFCSSHLCAVTHTLLHVSTYGAA